jgi:hypothetical protein
MTEAVLANKGLSPSLQWPDLPAAADRAINWALESCARLMDLDGPSAAAHQMQQGNAVARMHCCTSVTQEIAKALGTSEKNIRAVFAPDHDVLFEDLCSDAQAQHKPLVSLMVWTKIRTANLDSLVLAWDRALVKACRENIGAHNQTSLLDVHIVDDVEIQKCFGAGRGAVTATRLAVYWMWSTNQVVDIVYDREEEHR